MAYGSVLTDVVQSSVTGTPPQFNDGSGTQTGTLCRSWCNFNGTSGASPVVRASFNTSSVTRTGTGTYNVVFVNALTDANYSVLITGPNLFTPSSLATTGFSISAANYLGAAADFSLITTGIFR